MSLTNELILRVVIGGLLGGLVGFERGKRAKDAGFRTHFLVALGSTLLAVISGYGYGEVSKIFPGIGYDASRIAAQIVSGIGFIGAGLIIFNKNVVHGLTTAAGLWVTAAIGIACGVGRYELAAIATVMVLITLELSVLIEQRQNKRQLSINLASKDKEKITRLVEGLKADGVHLRNYDLKVADDGKGKFYSADIELTTKHDGYEERVWSLMEGMEGTVVSHMTK